MPEIYNDNVLQIFKEMSINNHFNVIGSAAIKRAVNYGDYDLSTVFKCNSKNCVKKIKDHFIKLFKIAKKNKDLWVTDLKIGEKNGEPIRWKQADLEANKKDNVSFEDALLMKSTIKIDIVYYLNGRFIEITDNYYFTIGANKTYVEPTKSEIVDSITESYEEYSSLNKHFKALKRLYSILRLKPKTEKKQELLLDYFNSEIGLLYRITTEIETIILLLENHKVPFGKLDETFEIMKETISSFPVKLKITEPKSKRGTITMLKKQYDINMKYLNKDALKFMRSHRL